MSCSACSAPPAQKPVRASVLKADEDEKVVIVDGTGGGGGGLIIAIVVIVVIIIIAICVGCACNGGSSSSEKVCLPVGSVVSTYSAAPTAPMVQRSIAGGSMTSSLSSLSSM